jgi:hypothetical protein
LEADDRWAKVLRMKTYEDAAWDPLQFNMQEAEWMQAMDRRVRDHLRRNLLDSPMRKRIRLPQGVGPGDFLKIRDDVGGGSERRYQIQVGDHSVGSWAIIHAPRM